MNPFITMNYADLKIFLADLESSVFPEDKTLIPEVEQAIKMHDNMRRRIIEMGD